MTNLKCCVTFIFVTVFLLKVGESLLPYDHADALYYHLAGARIWYESSWSEIWVHLTGYAQAGYFDFVYFLLFFVSHSLLKIQVLGQFLHFFFSLGLGSLFIFWRLESSIWGILGALSLLTIAKDASYFLYAKNDGVLALLSLIATYLIINRKNLYLIALFLGLLIGVKMSGMLVVIPLSLILAWDYRRQIPKLIGPALLALIIILPKLIENYIYTGNPLFPALLKKIPGTLTPAILDHYFHFFGLPLGPEVLKRLLADFFLGKVIFLLAIPLLLINFWKKNYRINLYYLVGLSVFALYLLLNGGYQAARFFFSGYFLTVFFIFITLKTLDSEKKYFEKKRSLILVGVLALILIDGKIDKSLKRGFYAVRDFSTLSEKEILKRHIPHVAIWEQLEKPLKSALILTDYHSESFYLPSGYRLHQPDHTMGPNFFYYCKEPGDIERIYQYRYVLLGFWRDNPCYHHVTEKTKLIFSWNQFKLYQLF